jgi:hypothetical protein
MHVAPERRNSRTRYLRLGNVFVRSRPEWTPLDKRSPSQHTDHEKSRFPGFWRWIECVRSYQSASDEPRQVHKSLVSKQRCRPALDGSQHGRPVKASAQVTGSYSAPFQHQGQGAASETRSVQERAFGHVGKFASICVTRNLAKTPPRTI